MPGIFLSYRREDTAGHAGRIFDRLRDEFGSDKVFMDVTAIEPGVDFVEAIDHAVGSCDVLLVIIGKRWLSCTDAAGKRRLDDSKDFIRLETAAALRRNIRVIPVLVQGAVMPSEDELPDDLKKLARRQATDILDTHWDASIEQLIETLAKVLPREPSPTATAGSAALSTPIAEKLPAAHSAGERGSPRRWIVAAIAAALVALAVAVFIGLPKKIEVPDLLGRSLDDAVAQLEQLQLKPGAVKHKLSDQPSGQVIEQYPPPGSRLARQSAVDLVLAEQPQKKMAIMPKLIGQPLEHALGLLKDAQLAAAEPVRKVTREAAEGVVLNQTPDAGTKLEVGAAVELVVAQKPPEETHPTPPAMAIVPKLVGQPLERALQLLKQAKLTAAKPVRKETGEAAEGTVLDQAPRAGTKLQRGKAVELVVAIAPAPPAMIKVPDVTKLDVKQAIVLLRDAGLTARPKLESIATSRAERGTVLKQSLKSGTEVRADETISLYYAVPPREEPAVGDIALPDFTGWPVSKVDSYLKAKGLDLAPLREKPSNEQRPGTVLAQRPPANAQVKKGEQVMLLVAAPMSGGRIVIKARTNPPVTSPGQKVSVDIYVQDAQGQALSSAIVTLSSGGGRFDRTGTTTISGATNSSGTFRAYWSCDPCAPAYVSEVRVSKPGYEEATAQWRVELR